MGGDDVPVFHIYPLTLSPTPSESLPYDYHTPPYSHFIPPTPYSYKSSFLWIQEDFMYKKCMRSHCLSDFIYCKVLTLPSPYTLEYTYEYIYKWCQVQIYSNFLDRWFDIKVEYVLKKTKA